MAVVVTANHPVLPVTVVIDDVIEQHWAHKGQYLLFYCCFGVVVALLLLFSG